MNIPDQDPLLKQVLADDSLEVVRRTSLDEGLRVMRRARRIRLVARVGTISLLGGLLVVLLMFYGPAPKTVRRSTPPAVVPANVASTPSPESGVKMISDDELFALFPGRSLALIGKPGHQQLVFLDSPKRP